MPYGILGLIIFILDLIAIVDIIKSSAPAANKLIWVLVVLFLPVIGMLLYFLIGRGKTA